MSSQNHPGRVITICLGVLCSFLYGGFIGSSSWVKKLELKIQDSLVKLRSSTVPPSREILLIKIDKNRDFLPEIKDRRSFYAQIATWVLAQSAEVVVLNFPHEWTTPNLDIINEKTSHLQFYTFESAIENLVENNRKRVVLVSPTNRVPNPYHTQISNFSHFIPLDENVKDPFSYPKSSPQLQGFFEYENIEGEKPSNLTSPARRAYNKGIFAVNSQDIQFQSFAWLTLEKYQLNRHNKKPKIALPQTNIQINYWHPFNTFTAVNLKDLCLRKTDNPCQINDTNKALKNIQGKIVIIGFTEGEELDVLAMESPFGEMIPGIEVQANILSSLMTHSYYQTLPDFMVILIYILTGVIIGCTAISGTSEDFILTPDKSLKARLGSIVIRLFVGGGKLISFKYIVLGMVGVYGSLSIIAPFWGWMLPVVSPILTTIVTAISVAVYIKNNQLIQENEGKKLQIAEEKAIISKSKKLIRRIWSEIHDDALQELKVAMYQIEFSSLPDSDSEGIIDRLSYVGKEIRKHLRVDFDSELTLQPELRQGLAPAMAQHLEKLTNSGTLKLKVVTNLKRINEPELNSNWIDAREDIFRFFREAINNVIRHAQGGTQVVVSLSQEDEQCTLIIENDGAVVSNADQIEGLGTKLMAEMASTLPDGFWERNALPNGGMRVKLIWEQRF
jgi:signal transduction histidine kinase